MEFLKAILTLIFGQEEPFLIALRILYAVGVWRVLVKCGDKGWKALIPCYEKYALAKCANRANEGVVLFIAEVVKRFFMAQNFFFPIITDENLDILRGVIILCAMFVQLIYLARVALGLCRLFDKKPYWAILWGCFQTLPALYWGFNPKIQPKWNLEDLQSEVATYLSGSHAEVLKNGLTVNLEDRTVSENHKKKTLLRDIHMNIAPGHMVLLLGGSGAGKTTLLNAINGYEKANAQIMLNDNDVYTHYKQMQYQIGFVPQLDLMRPKDTVVNTLYDAAALRLPSEFSKKERHERVEQVMETFGLTRLKQSLVEKLSGGQRKRLSIAMEFISNPTLFILDEPDSGLDGVMARELMLQLRNIADQGKIVMVITHTPDRVIDLFDDVIVLAKDSSGSGRLAFFGPIDEAKTFFERDTMEQLVRCINRKEEGGEGRADEIVKKFSEVQHG